MPISNYTIPLKVCDTEGNRIVARIIQINNTENRLVLPFIEVVRNDRPEFATNGRIIITYKRGLHVRTINKLVSYLEDLMLKELGKDGNNNSGNAVGNDRSGSEKSSDSGTDKVGERENVGSIHGRGGRTKLPKGYRRRKSEPDLAEGSDTQDGGEDTSGD